MSTLPPQIPQSSNADVFVLSCIDPRFTYYLNWFLNYQSEIKNTYDLFTLAGSSLGVVQSLWTSPKTPVYLHWDTTFFDNLALGIALHGITEIWVFDHLGCGAYKNFLRTNSPPSVPNGDDSEASHIVQLNNLKDIISNHTSAAIRNLKFKGFVMDLKGGIKLVNTDNTGVVPKFIKSENYTYEIIVLVLLFIIIYNYYNKSFVQLKAV